MSKGYKLLKESEIDADFDFNKQARIIRKMIASYNPPTPEEVRRILKALELTATQATKLLSQKSVRTVRKYTSDASNTIEMPYSVLFTLIAKSQGFFISAENWRFQLYNQPVNLLQKPSYMRD